MFFTLGFNFIIRLLVFLLDIIIIVMYYGAPVPRSTDEGRFGKGKFMQKKLFILCRPIT